MGDLAEMLSDEALAEIYAYPHPKIAGVFGKTGAVLESIDGGFRVRGGALAVQQRVSPRHLGLAQGDS